MTRKVDGKMEREKDEKEERKNLPSVLCTKVPSPTIKHSLSLFHLLSLVVPFHFSLHESKGEGGK